MLDTLTRILDELMRESIFKAVFSAIGSVVASMLGGVSTLVIVLFMLLCVDFILGFIRAWKGNAVNGGKMRAGAYKMIFYAFAVFVVAAVEHAVRSCGVPFPVRDFFLAFLCVNEALSCMEHLAFFGVPFPTRLREKLRNYRDGILNDKKEVNNVL